MDSIDCVLHHIHDSVGVLLYQQGLEWLEMIDNYSLWKNHDAEQEEALSKLPICRICGEHIQQDTAICIDGKWYCDHCLNEYFRKDI